MTTAELQLARVEGWRLVRNPVVWLAFGLSGLWLRSAARTDNAEDAYNLLVGYGLVLPGLVMILLTVLSVIRARSAGTEEVLSTVPVTRDRRTLGHGLSTIACGALGVAWLVVTLAVLQPGRLLGTRYGLRDEPTMTWTTLEIPRPTPAQLLQGPVALVAVGCIAVALVRWVPTWLAVVPFVFAALMQLTFAGLWAGAPLSLADWLNPMSRGWVHNGWAGECGADGLCELELSGFDRVTPWWHLAYLVVLAVVFVAVAVLRHRRDRAAWTLASVSLAALVALAVVQSVVYRRFAPLSPT